MVKAQCPECTCREVLLVITTAAEGILDDDGNLESQTESESIEKMTCRACGKELPLTIIKTWSG